MTTTRDEDGPEPVAVGTPAAPIAYVGISPEAKAKADQFEAKLRAMLSTPATEPQAGLDAVADAARLLLKKWDADTAMGLVYDASAFVSLMRSIAARPAPQPAAWAWDADGFLQPAADTRVAPQEAAQILYDTMTTNRPIFDAMVKAAEDIEPTGVSFNRVVGDALRAAIAWEAPTIIGTATPAPSDKIAEAARDVAKAVDEDMLFFNKTAFNFDMSMDMPVKHFFAQALRKFADARDAAALAGQGETP